MRGSKIQCVTECVCVCVRALNNNLTDWQPNRKTCSDVKELSEVANFPKQQLPKKGEQVTKTFVCIISWHWHPLLRIDTVFMFSSHYLSFKLWIPGFPFLSPLCQFLCLILRVRVCVFVCMCGFLSCWENWDLMRDTKVHSKISCWDRNESLYGQTPDTHTLTNTHILTCCLCVSVWVAQCLKAGKYFSSRGTCLSPEWVWAGN